MQTWAACRSKLHQYSENLQNPEAMMQKERGIVSRMLHFRLDQVIFVKLKYLDLHISILQSIGSPVMSIWLLCRGVWGKAQITIIWWGTTIRTLLEFVIIFSFSCENNKFEGVVRRPIKSWWRQHTFQRACLALIAGVSGAYLRR